MEKIGYPEWIMAVPKLLEHYERTDAKRGGEEYFNNEHSPTAGPASPPALQPSSPTAVPAVEVLGSSRVLACFSLRHSAALDLRSCGPQVCGV